jgi:hypothetical protein
MAGVLIDHLSTLPPDRHVLVAGDMNLYSGFEDAMQTLISTTSDIWLNDPLDEVGGWSGSSFYAPLHTQSTRINQLYGDGSGGGLDDRFDLVLLSEGLMDPGSPLHYQAGSYHALGNSGDCFNQNVTDCDSTLTPFAVLRSLFYMSDHLPVTLTLAFDPLLDVAEAPASDTPQLLVIDAGGGPELLLRDAEGPGILWLCDAMGRRIREREVGGGDDRMSLAGLQGGPWIASFTSANGRWVVKVPFLH